MYRVSVITSPAMRLKTDNTVFLDPPRDAERNTF